MDRLIFWSLATLVALAPLPLGSNRIWAWSLLGIGVGTLLIAWSVAAAWNRRLIGVSWRRYRVALFIFTPLLAWLMVQNSGLAPASLHHPLWRETAAILTGVADSAIGLNPDEGWGVLIRIMTYAGIFFLAMQLGTNSERATQALWLLMAAGVGYALYGLAVFLGGWGAIIWYDKWAYREALTSTFVNKNSYATYAGIGLITALALLQHATRGGPAISLTSRAGVIRFFDGLTPAVFVLAVAVLILATALLFSQSRGGFIATVAGALVLFAAFAWDQRRRGGHVAILGVFLAAGGVALLSFSGDALLSRMAEGLSQGTGRGELHATTIRAILDHPWTGTGLGTFKGVFFAYRDEALAHVPVIFAKAHSTYLEFALEAGLPAFIALMALLGMLSWRCLLGVVRRRRSRTFPSLGLAATALVGLHSAFDFSMQMPAVAATYFLILGIAFAHSWPTSQRGRSGTGRAMAEREPDGGVSR